MVKTSTQRAKETRERKRKKGMIPKHIWIYPADWPEIKAFIEFKNTVSEQKKSKK